jgi:putative endonuclease
MYHLYIVRCRDGTFYTGITTSIARRIEEHNHSPKGAKYTRARRPVVLVYQRRFRNRKNASIAEAALKKLSRSEKNRLVIDARRR